MPTESDGTGNEPNLELPSLSLGFGRRKKRAAKAADETAPIQVDTTNDDLADAPEEPESSAASAPAEEPATAPTPRTTSSARCR